MTRSLAVFLGAAIVVFSSPLARGQTRDVGLVSSTQATQLGLERAWYTHAAVDRGRGRVKHVAQHVNATDKYTVFEVVSDRGRRTFSERDLDRFGAPLGKDAAAKLAQRTADDWNLEHQNAKLTTHVLPKITLYVMTDQGVVQSVDAETGRTLWVTAVGNARHPSEAPAANDKYVAAVNGSTLTVLEQGSGKMVWQRQVIGAPGAGPVLSDRYAFVPMLSGAIEGYDLESYRETPWVFQSHGRAMVQPIFTGEHIAWTTDQGHLNVAKGNENAIRFRIETEESIVSGAVFLSPDRLLVASTDGYVYCVQESRGAVVWRFSTGEPIVQAPVVVGNRAYIITVDGHLFLISGDQGVEQWQVAGIRQFVAASSDRLYCLDDLGRLTILDAATGAPVGSLPGESLDLVLVNNQTDRIILGTQDGRLQCLHETKQPWPLIHPGVLPAPKEPGADGKKKKKPAAEAPKPEKPADENPFGADMPAAPAAGKKDAGDPFGAEPAEPAAPAAGEKPAADPFEAAPAEPAAGAKPAEGAAPASDPFGFQPGTRNGREKQTASDAKNGTRTTRRARTTHAKDKARRADAAAKKHN